MAEKHSAPPTSYDAFFHGLGHWLSPPTSVGGSAIVRSADVAGTFRGDADAPKLAIAKSLAEA
jgi:hypothetical protein